MAVLATPRRVRGVRALRLPQGEAEAPPLHLRSKRAQKAAQRLLRFEISRATARAKHARGGATMAKVAPTPPPPPAVPSPTPAGAEAEAVAAEYARERTPPLYLPLHDRRPHAPPVHVMSLAAYERSRRPAAMAAATTPATPRPPLVPVPPLPLPSVRVDSAAEAAAASDRPRRGRERVAGAWRGGMLSGRSEAVVGADPAAGATARGVAVSSVRRVAGASIEFEHAREATHASLVRALGALTTDRTAAFDYKLEVRAVLARVYVRACAHVARLGAQALEACLQAACSGGKRRVTAARQVAALCAVLLHPSVRHAAPSALRAAGAAGDARAGGAAPLAAHVAGAAAQRMVRRWRGRACVPRADRVRA